MKHDAIYNLYPNVTNINEDKGTFVCKDNNGNEISIDMSAVNTKATELQAEADAKVQADKDLKASAREKLMAGEPLTKEEASTIVL
tara:strand:+ start:254 stop:511 length:258 start_codon:yes stop_codon:yes gene_type:complete